MLLLVYLFTPLVSARRPGAEIHRSGNSLAASRGRPKRANGARARVHSYVFSQILASPEANRITRLMMQLIVYVTFAVLPIVTLLCFQWSLSPFHEVWSHYWHRLAVILGLAMLILLHFPIMQHAPPKRKWDIGLGPQAEAWEASGP